MGQFEVLEYISEFCILSQPIWFSDRVL